jgi:soluble lytic murein transglycosylase-like protein
MVILTEDHIKAIRRINKRHWVAHAIGLFLTLAIIAVSYVWKLERDLNFESYRLAKMEFGSILAKQKLLTGLRPKSLTLSQALDVVDVVMSQSKIPRSLVLAIMDVESTFDPDAVSRLGAKGLMQATPETANKYSGHPSTNIHDPIVNVRTGIRYLSDLKDTYGDWPRTLRSYNGGPKNKDNEALNGYVERVMAKAAVFEKELEQ